MARSATALATLISTPPHFFRCGTAARLPCTVPHHATVDTDAGIVHPGVDSAEFLDRALGDDLDFLHVRHICRLPRAPRCAASFAVTSPIPLDAPRMTTT